MFCEIENKQKRVQDVSTEPEQRREAGLAQEDYYGKEMWSMIKNSTSNILLKFA